MQFDKDIKYENRIIVRGSYVHMSKEFFNAINAWNDKKSIKNFIKLIRVEFRTFNVFFIISRFIKHSKDGFYEQFRNVKTI